MSIGFLVTFREWIWNWTEPSHWMTYIRIWIWIPIQISLSAFSSIISFIIRLATASAGYSFFNCVTIFAHTLLASFRTLVGLFFFFFFGGSEKGGILNCLIPCLVLIVWLMQKLALCFMYGVRSKSSWFTILACWLKCGGKLFVPWPKPELLRQIHITDCLPVASDAIQTQTTQSQNATPHQPLHGQESRPRPSLVLHALRTAEHPRPPTPIQ